MRLTFAQVPTGLGDSVLNEIKPPNILVAFPYKKGEAVLNYSPEYFITDSGAFTAWSIGKSIDIDEYAAWSLEMKKKHPRVISVNLDVIPGEKGRVASEKERIQGSLESLKNADYLRSKGLNVMEVFHQFESRAFLDELLDRLPEDGILGISPRNDAPLSKKLEWLNLLLKYFRSKYPLDKFPRCHGLGATAPGIVKTFPFYSVDSSSWMSPMRFGSAVDDWGVTSKAHLVDGKKMTVKDSRDFVRNSIRQSVTNQMRLSDSTTALWEKRGIRWKD